MTGTLEGPDLDGCRYVLGATHFPVIAAGGVGERCATSWRSPGCASSSAGSTGVIVGRAFASGELAVVDAMAACEA